MICTSGSERRCVFYGKSSNKYASFVETTPSGRLFDGNKMSQGCP